MVSPFFVTPVKFICHHVLLSAALPEENLLNIVGHPESRSLLDSFFEPVIEGRAFINQETPYSYLC
jgi:hypothetical protein